MDSNKTKSQIVEEKIGDFSNKLQPKEKSDIIRNNAWLGTCAATMALGIITHERNLPTLRALAHLGGSLAIPAGGAFISSLAMHGIEGAVNLGIKKYNERHPENQKENFEINPKVKNAIKLLSSAVFAFTYARATSLYELDRFIESGNFQLSQYVADWAGVVGGTALFGQLDIKDTFGSFMGKIWKAGQIIGKPIDKVIDLFKGKTTPEKSQDLESSENFISEKEDITIPDELSVYNYKPIEIQAHQNPAIDAVASPDMTLADITTADSKEVVSSPSVTGKENDGITEEDEIDI